MNKYLGLDIGDKRIGVAISREGKLAFSYEVINVLKTRAVYRIKDIVREENIDTIVVGYPLRLNGNEEIQVEKIEKFTKKLSEKIKGINIVFFDERLSTKEAHNMLKNSGKSMKESRNIVDMIAASIILQTYLDKNKLEE